MVKDDVIAHRARTPATSRLECAWHRPRLPSLERCN
jgi:hypothetical protein